MKKHLNTLYVMTQGSYIAKEGLSIVIKKDKKVNFRVPVHNIGGIVCFGNVSCSPFLMGFCAENNVGISFLTERGKFLARVYGPVSGNVLLRREQYRKADNNDTSLEIARFVLTGKIANCRIVLQRSLRDHSEKINSEEINKVSLKLKNALKNLPKASNLDEIRGFEGDAAHNYFQVFDHLIISNKDEFSFMGRNRRPPLDEVNCLLSFLYTILMHDIRSSLEAVGLDPSVGFLHRDRPGRPGLALDLMEEFRPFIADRIALSLINLSQIKKTGFNKTESGAVMMDDETRKIVLTAYQKRKQEEIMHPFINEKVEIGLLFHIQALLMSRFLRGDLDGYPPFITR